MPEYRGFTYDEVNGAWWLVVAGNWMCAHECIRGAVKKGEEKRKVASSNSENTIGTKKRETLTLLPEISLLPLLFFHESLNKKRQKHQPLVFWTRTRLFWSKCFFSVVLKSLRFTLRLLLRTFSVRIPSLFLFSIPGYSPVLYPVYYVSIFHHLPSSVAILSTVLVNVSRHGPLLFILTFLDFFRFFFTIANEFVSCLTGLYPGEAKQKKEKRQQQHNLPKKTVLSTLMCVTRAKSVNVFEVVFRRHIIHKKVIFRRKN